MVKAVFIQSDHSDYLDREGEVYHFPKRNYLSTVLRTVGDWVLLYEGRRGSGRGYYAVQRVARIEDDPADQTHAFAIMDRGSWLDLERSVGRLRPLGTPWETGLPIMGGKNTSSVRAIADEDFAAILTEGFRGEDVPDTLDRQPGLQDAAASFEFGGLRPQVLTSRAFRDRAFARMVKRAYAGRCAFSGLEIRNGGGRPEVEAAHIVPVEKQGQDRLQNGIALSGTLHWMFDRGLISVDEDHSLLIASNSIADDVARRLIRPEGRMLLPALPSEAPHPAFLRWHRQTCFKG